MSMFESNHYPSGARRRTPAPLSTADDAMLRAIGVLILLGIGAMHFLQIVTTFKATPLLGGAYVVLIAACVVVGGGLVASGDSRTWTAAGVVSAGAIGGYILTRMMSTPLDNQDLGNWSCMLGLAALFVETSLLALSGYSLAALRSRREIVAAVAGVEAPRTGRMTAA